MTESEFTAHKRAFIDAVSAAVIVHCVEHRRPSDLAAIVIAKAHRLGFAELSQIGSDDLGYEAARYVKWQFSFGDTPKPTWHL